MPEIRLELRGGIDVERSPSLNRGGWSLSNLIRWRRGAPGTQPVPEKQRGWVLFANQKLTGKVCRSLHFWTDLVGTARVAAATETNIQFILNGTIYDITPTGPTYGPGTVSSGAPPLYTLRIVSLDNFGQVLIIAPNGLPLFQWTPPTVAPAQQITNSPPQNQGAFVAAPQQQVIAFGSSPDGGTSDPLLVRWCDIGDFTTWDASTTNQAGSFRLSRGNRIISGNYTPNGIFLETDDDIWVMQYEGFPLVYGFYLITENAGLIAQNAWALLGSTPYWMSDHGFFTMTGGGAQQIPCPVWDVVFLDLDQNNMDKCVAAPNYHYNEILWFYPSLSGGTGEIDSWVRYNIENGAWDYGKSVQFVRTAWTDQNKPGTPLGACLAPYVHMHDVGLDADLDVNGNPATVPITGVMVRSGFNDMAEGKEVVFADRFIPDFIWEGTAPSLTMSLYFRLYPDDTPTVVGPFTITPSTKFQTLANFTNGKLIRPRGREWAIELDCSALDSWFRMGACRLRTSPDGTGP